MAVTGAMSATALATGDGTAGTMVVGGSAVSAGTYDARYRSAVTILDASQTDARDAHFCGGTLIAPQKVVTAAHCVVDYDERVGQATIIKPSSIHVLGGRRVLSHTSAGERVKVSRIVVHKEFDIYNIRNDFAILSLAKQPSGSVPVQMVGASEQGLWGNGSGLAEGADGPWVAGWGYFNQYNFPGWGYEPIALADTLQEASLPIISDDECENGGPGNGGAGWGRYFDASSMLCASVLDTSDLNDGNSDSNGRGACYGDSGGPLLVSDGSGGYRLAGLVSWGFMCADRKFHGVFTRIDTMRPFAEQNLPAPVAKVKDPVVMGPTVVGAQLGCTQGTWRGGGTITYKYRWLRSNFTVGSGGGWDDDDGDDWEFRRGAMRATPTPRSLVPTYSGFSVIEGATGARLKLTSKDVRRFVFCEVTAENASWRQRAISRYAGPVVRIPFPPQARVVGRRCEAAHCFVTVRATQPNGGRVVQVASRWSRTSGSTVSGGTMYAKNIKGNLWQFRFRRNAGAWQMNIRAKDQFQNRSQPMAYKFNVRRRA